MNLEMGVTNILFQLTLNVISTKCPTLQCGLKDGSSEDILIYSG